MVDLSFLEKFSKGDTNKMKRYIKIYLSFAPDTFKNMEQHVVEKDWEQLRIKAHSLKPQADYMGIPRLKSALTEIEDVVSSGKFEQLGSLFEIAQNIYYESELPLKAYIDSH